MRAFDGRLSPRRLISIGALSVACAAFAMLLLFSLSYLSLRTDNARAEAKVRAAFAAGVLRQDIFWLTGDTRIGSHQWNDCLILFQAIARQAPLDRLVISPLTLPTNKSTGPCPDLAAQASGHPLSVVPEFYHQYLHGHTVAARLLLAVLPVAGVRAVYSATLTLLVILGLIQAMIALASGRRRGEALFWLVTFLVFSRWFGLESFGQSLCHGPADCVVLGFLLLLARCSATGGLDPRRLPFLAACFGALTIIFEFLTGGIPLGLAILIGAVPFALRPLDPGRGETLARAVIEGLFAFGATIVVCIAVKLALVLWVFGPGAFTSISSQLLFRIGLGPAPATVVGEHTASLFDFGVAIASGLESLAAGARPMTFLMLVVSICAGAWGFVQTRAVPEAEPLRPALTALALSNLPIYLWLVLFFQHTAEHARFMDRILAWTIASGFAIYTLAVSRRLAAAASDDRAASKAPGASSAR